MARLTLQFLGSFGVTFEKQDVTHFRSINVQGLLLYLCLQPGRSFSRASLATLFWPDEPTSNAKSNLRQSLHRLKKILPQPEQEPPFFLIDRQSVKFNPDSDFRCDVHRFEAAATAGEARVATDLYRGELAAGFTVDSLEFEEWLRLEREYLHQKALNSFKALTLQQVAGRDYTAAQSTAQRHLQLDPWGELAHRHLMLALALNGDRSGALAQYESCVAVLDDELGVEPEAETLDLADKIRDGNLDGFIEEIPQPVQRLNKTKILDRLEPLPDQKLFGIAKPLQKGIEAIGADTRPWLVALDGLGGIGKTTMANEVVRYFLETDRFLDIAWVSAKQEEYVTGRGIRETAKPALDPESCLDQLLAQLAEGPYPANNFDAKRLALHQILQDKPSLIVIDNLETVADYEALLPLLRFLSRPSKILITTRRSLRHESDIFCMNLSELPQEEAIQLLKHEARSQEIGSLLYAEDETFVEIYDTIGGNPLALKLALGQAHYIPIEQILAGLKVTKERQMSDLYVYIYWQAWQMLDTDGRHLFVSLPMVPNGTFDQLKVASGQEPEVIQQSLRTLRSLSLVEVSAGGAHPRYRIHRLTETFLLNEVIKWQKADTAALEPAREHFEERLTVLLDHRLVEQKMMTIDVKELDAEKEGILKAIHFGLDFDPSWPVVKELISALTSYMERWGHWVVWQETLERAIGVAQKLSDTDGELVMMNLRGRLLQRLGRLDDLIKNYRQVIRLARRTGNRIEAGRACSNLGFNLIDRGQYWRAEVLNCHALEIFDQFDYPHGQAHTCNHLGLLFTETGRWEWAEAYLDRAITTWEEMDDQFNMIMGLLNKGILLNQQKASGQAIAILNTALEKARALNDFGNIANLLLSLSTSMTDSNRYADAEAFALEAEQAYRRSLNYLGVYKAQTALGISLREQQKWASAARYFDAAIAGFRSIRNREWEMRVEIEQLKNSIDSDNEAQALVSATRLKRLRNGNERFIIQTDLRRSLQKFDAFSALKQ